MDQLMPSKPLSIDLGIVEGLQDKEFREVFFRSELESSVPGQIRALRLLRGLKQSDLARLLQTKQSAVSRMEQEGYGKWGIDTLLKVADALDARLAIVLEPFEHVIERFKADARPGPATSALSATLESSHSNASARLAESQPGFQQRNQTRRHQSAQGAARNASAAYGTGSY